MSPSAPPDMLTEVTVDEDEYDEDQQEQEEYTRYGLTTSDEGVITFNGLLLGEGSSKRDSHTHRPGTLPPQGRSCSGCRWTETRIFWSEDDNQWIIHTIGKTTVDGESNRYKIVWAAEAKDVIDSLLVKSKFIKDGVRQLELPKANAAALKEASENDEEIDDCVQNYSFRQPRS